MKQRPILFSAPMVRALLDGSKTQTRRIVKPHGWTIDQMSKYEFVKVLNSADASGLTCEQPAITAYAGFRLSPNAASLAYFKSPYGTVGDQLWVRETHLTVCKMDDNGMFITDEHGEYIYETWYRADGIDYQYFDGQSDFPVENVPWKPSIHMPRAASRITLEITSVRVERLQDISHQDAIAEGVALVEGAPLRNERLTVPQHIFAHLWESINGDGSWEANPWVWVLDFKRVEQ